MNKTSQQLANAYDFDHTIYRGDASLDFIIYCLAHYPANLRYAPFQAWTVIFYLIGKRDRKQVKQVAFLFLKNIKNIDEVTHHFWNKHEHKIESWYLGQKQSSDTIVSASPEFLLEPIAAKLGVKTLIGTRMNKTTGKISGGNCRGEEKVLRIKEIGLGSQFENVYSDTLSDLPLLSMGKKPYIVRKGSIMPLEQYQSKTQPRSSEQSNSKRALMRELLLYGIIGGSTAALDVILFHMFVAVGIPLLLANFISVSVAVGSSFTLNAKYNFKKTDNITKRAAKFFSIGFFGWFVQSIILLIGVDAIGLSETYVKIFAVFVAAAIQYLLNKFLTFKD